MHFPDTLYSSLIFRTKTLALVISTLAVSGTVTELLGGIWDASSHAMREPEQFWTIQHVVIYTGVSMIAASAILGLILLVTINKNQMLRKGIKIVVLGSVLQLTAGYADSVSHEIYGVDGLVTPSHLVLETGLLLSALGGFIILCHIDRGKTRKMMVPLAIMTVILSATWIGFNLFLLFGAVVLCVSVYEMFSSGCAVL